jgi:hypothetical protein
MVEKFRSGDVLPRRNPGPLTEKGRFVSDDPIPAWAVNLKALREARGWVEADLAREIKDRRPNAPDVGTLTRMIRSDWESGEHVPKRYFPVIAQIYRTTVDAILSEPPLGPHKTSPDPAATAVTNASGRMAESPIEWDEMERRILLQLAATLGAGSFANSITGEPIRQFLEISAGSEPKDVADWITTCADHLYGIRTRPPGQVRDDLAIDLYALHRQLLLASTADRVELQRVAAALSLLHANVLTHLGEHGAAIRWWRTGRNAAEAARDAELQIVATATEAGFGLYGQRPPEVVLALARKAQRIDRTSKGVGYAMSVCTEAKALSLLGRHQEAIEVVKQLSDFSPNESVNELIPAYWTDDQVAFTESWVYAGAGNDARADAARDRVLKLTNSYVYGVNVRLHEALCAVSNGGVEPGARHATEIIDTLPASQQSMMTIEMGNVVLRAMPSNSQNGMYARNLRAVLAEKHNALVIERGND